MSRLEQFVAITVDAGGANRNRLRQWDKNDFIPHPEDIYQERLYCIQWITKESVAKRRQETFYSAVTPDDIRRERQVGAIVAENLSQWQAEGLVPDMRIEPGDKTDEPIRTRGWTHWHHFFGARQLFLLAKAVPIDVGGWRSNFRQRAQFPIKALCDQFEKCKLRPRYVPRQSVH